MELVYLDAENANRKSQAESYTALDSTKFALDKQGMDSLRTSLGHPLSFYSYSARCIVSSVHGLDAASSADRYLVASRLWAEGIGAEYLAQSGVLASLLRRQREEREGTGASVSSKRLVPT